MLACTLMVCWFQGFTLQVIETKASFLEQELVASVAFVRLMIDIERWSCLLCVSTQAQKLATLGDRRLGGVDQSNSDVHTTGVICLAAGHCMCLVLRFIPFHQCVSQLLDISDRYFLD